MRKVFCPKTGEMEWANEMADGNYRCTKCGELHSK